MESRETIQRQLMEKFDAVLVRYGEEVSLCTSLFNKHLRNPTVLIGKNQPPVAGAISYASSLYRRAKKPIMRFIQSTTLKSSPLWDQERERYLELARRIDSYCSSLYEKWIKHSTTVVTRELSEFILGPSPREARDENGKRTVILPTTRGEENDKWYVNFSSQLSELIREAKYLDRHGYVVPDSVLNVALQGDIYTSNIVQLKQMLQHYEEELSALSPVEMSLFAKPIADLHRDIEPGFNVLNWSSLNIPLYITRANKATENFRSVLRRVRKSSDSIESYVKQVASTNLINEQDFLLMPNGPRHEAMDFYFKLDKRRTQVLEDLSRIGDTLRSMFIQIELLVSSTDTGRSPDLHSYYVDCERRIYNAVCEMIVRSIATFQSLLNVGDAADGSAPREALIQLRATVSKGSGDVQMTPALPDVLRYVGRALDSIVDSANSFKRWEHGSCHSCRPMQQSKQQHSGGKGKNSGQSSAHQSKGAAQQTMDDDGVPYQYTMYDDVANNPTVVQMLVSTRQAIHLTHQKCKKYLES
jgi:dynein heavy chain